MNNDCFTISAKLVKNDRNIDGYIRITPQSICFFEKDKVVSDIQINWITLTWAFKKEERTRFLLFKSEYTTCTIRQQDTLLFKLIVEDINALNTVLQTYKTDFIEKKRHQEELVRQEAERKRQEELARLEAERKRQDLQCYTLVKLAMALSLRSKEPLQESDFHTNALGRELNRQTITGDADALYKCLMELYSNKHLTDEEFFPEYVKAHIDRGAILLDQEQRYGGEFLIHLTELEKSL